MAGLVMHRDRKVGLRASGLMLIFWILITIYGTFKFRTYILTGLDSVRLLQGGGGGSVPIILIFLSLL